MDDTKRFYTFAEVMNRLNITQARLCRKLILFNIEIRRLPGSNQEWIEDRYVERLERAIQHPTVDI